MLSSVDMFYGLVDLFFLSFLLLFFFYYFLIFLFLIIKNFFILITLFFSFFLSFFLPFLLSHVADTVLVLRLGVRPVPLRWESQVQDIGLGLQRPPSSS